MAKIFYFAISIFYMCCPLFAGAAQKAVSLDEILADRIASVKPSIVAVGTYYFNDIPKIRYLGTGFAISNGRRIVTNYHVVSGVIKDKKQPYLRIFHKTFGTRGILAKIIAIDKFHDLVILEQDGEPIPVLKIADSTKVREGYRVIFSGYPVGFVLGLNATTHTGIISSIAPLIKPSPTARIIDGKIIRHLNEPYDVFQIDGTAFPGNSGSPVCLMSTGEVIGVINQVFVKGKKEHAFTSPSGINYTLPARCITVLNTTIPSIK
ncbi:MAG: serine protease, partial [Desulfobacula sp.]|nr:serine protease [Desulfobacula sp.]